MLLFSAVFSRFTHTGMYVQMCIFFWMSVGWHSFVLFSSNCVQRVCAMVSSTFFSFYKKCVYIIYILLFKIFWHSIRCARACDPDASGSSEAAIFLVVHSRADWRTAGVSASLWPHFAPIIHSKSMLKFSATWVTSKHKITKIISVETVIRATGSLRLQTAGNHR